ncbi:hypothetical protein [Ferruginibacter sp.]
MENKLYKSKAIIKRVVCCIVALLLISNVHAQTICEKMQEVVEGLADKTAAIVKDKKKISQADQDYLVGIFKETATQLDRLIAGNTDKTTQLQYQYCTVYIKEQLAAYIAWYSIAPSYQQLYDIVQPVKNIAYTLDSALLKETFYIICDKANGTHNITNYTQYETVALDYYKIYMLVCCQLDKREEAEALYAHVKQQRFSVGVTSPNRYLIASALIRLEIAKHDNYTSIFNIATDMLHLYKDNYSYDTTLLKMPYVLIALGDPVMADSSIDDRSNDLYKIYQYLQFHPDEFFTAAIRSNILKRSMQCLTLHSNASELLESMKYNDHPVVDSIIAMEDAALLQKVITIAATYADRVGKLREPYFWKNLEKLYLKAGNTTAAADAEKKYKKYK